MILLFSIVFGLMLGASCGTSGHVITGCVVGLFIGLIIQMGFWDAKAKVQNPKARQKLIEETKRENKIANDYGIIDWEDK